MKSKKQRREEAALREAANLKLTPQERLAKLDAGGYLAMRQRARLNRLITQTKKENDE